jgi:cytochrome c-type biogenesis protein CcmH/NrfG
MRALRSVPLALLLGFLCFPARAADSPAKDLLRQGIRLANEGNHEAALEKLRQAVSKDGSDSSAQLALGMVALKNQSYGEARAALERAVSLDPASPAAHYGLAMLYEKSRETGKALASWEKFISLSKDAEEQELARRHVDRLRQVP